VDVVDFLESWRDGRAFNALIHKHRPDLIIPSYDALVSNSEPIENLRFAFGVAQTSLGVPSLLTPEDFEQGQQGIGERSVVMYLAQLYHCFHSSENDGNTLKADDEDGLWCDVPARLEIVTRLQEIFPPQ